MDNDIGEDCDDSDLSAVHELGDIQVSIFLNPISDQVYISVSDHLVYEAILFDISYKPFIRTKNAASIIVRDYSGGICLLQIIDLNSGVSL